MSEEPGTWRRNQHSCHRHDDQSTDGTSLIVIECLEMHDTDLSAIEKPRTMASARSVWILMERYDTEELRMIRTISVSSASEKRTLAFVPSNDWHSLSKVVTRTVAFLARTIASDQIKTTIGCSKASSGKMCPALFVRKVRNNMSLHFANAGKTLRLVPLPRDRNQSPPSQPTRPRLVRRTRGYQLPSWTF